MADQIIENLTEQILDLDRRERELEWELLDVFTDVTPVTPEDNEDDENDDNEEDQEENQFKQAILAAQAAPTEPCEYAGRYEDPNYLQDVSKKLNKMKNLVRQSNLGHVLENPRYLRELERIQRTYPDNGGRAMLNELVAVYIILGGD
jgi:hypothetical protein